MEPWIDNKRETTTYSNETIDDLCLLKGNEWGVDPLSSKGNSLLKGKHCLRSFINKT